MSPSARNWLIAASAGLLGLCLCGVLLLAALALSIFPWQTVVSTSGLDPEVVEATARPATVAPSETTDSAPDLTATPGPTTPSLSPEVQAQMDQIEGQVISLRGLHPAGPVDRSLLTPDELRQHVIDDFLADYSEADARDDVLALALLGLLDPDFDLLDLYIELYSEQVAGFYDDEVQTMYVVGTGFGGPERLTYAHEYVHALQDQTYGLRDGLGLNDEACEADSERCAGLRALIEGDASLLQEQWLRTYGTQQDLREILEFYQSFDSQVFLSAPAFLQEGFVFPYEGGISFVQGLFLEGGWAAVDAAYADPPLSTEQILHPERYPEDKPVRLQVPDLVESLGSGWREIERNTLGELDTRHMLAVHLPGDAAADAAKGWGGDFYLAFHNESGNLGALVMITAWDTIRDAQDYSLAFRSYGDSRFGDRASTPSGYLWESGEGYVIFERLSNQTLWILAPDKTTAGRLRSAVTFPAPKP